MSVSNPAVGGVLFDLDGTLVDSAPDLGGAVNAMRIRRNMTELPLAQLRPFASHGAKGLLQAGFDIDEDHPNYLEMRAEFLDYYEHHAVDNTCLFDGVVELLDYLDKANIVWGIVTNKHQRFTTPVVQVLGLDQRAHVIVCGDTTPHAKPHPAPMLYAAQRVQRLPEQLLYIGDDLRDIQAARAAGYAAAIAAAYGYADVKHIPDWHADACLQKPLDLVQWIENKTAKI